MKKGQYKCPGVLCPFYNKEDKHTIHCGAVLQNTSILMAFGNISDKPPYKKKYCSGKYTECPIYKILESV